MLPAATEEQFAKGFIEVIEAGWALPDLEPKDEVRFLLELADVPANATYSMRASRFLQMLDRSLRDNVVEIPDGAEEPILTDERSRGLRILYGTHPEYHTARWSKGRQENALPYLFPGRRKPLSVDAFQRSPTYRGDIFRLTLSCLIASYGQAEFGSVKARTSLGKFVKAIVGQDHRIESVDIAVTTRLNIDGVPDLPVRYGAHQPERIADVVFEPVDGDIGPPTKGEPYGQGTYRVRFPITRTTLMGDVLKWTYRRRLTYVPGSVLPNEDWECMSARSDNFDLGVEVMFKGEIPPIIWQVRCPKEWRPGRPENSVLLKPDVDQCVTMPPLDKTNGRYSYGIAWRWTDL